MSEEISVLKVRTICGLMGWDLDEIKSAARHRFLVIRRRMIAEALNARGLNHCAIGRAINRDHSVIEHYLKNSFFFTKEEEEVLRELNEKLDVCE